MNSAKINISKSKIKQFCERYQVSRLALFGSILRDDFRPDSDIDVLIVFYPSAQVSFMTLGKMRRELEGLFHRKVDLVLQDGLKPAIRDAVLSTAQVVYAA